MSKLKLKNNPATTEHAVAYPPTVGDDLTRIVPCGDEQEANECRDSFLARGIEAIVIKREISPWTVR